MHICRIYFWNMTSYLFCQMKEQGRINDYSCRGRLGRGSNDLGRGSADLGRGSTDLGRSMLKYYLAHMFVTKRFKQYLL